ncbi:hypothetical protein CHS0354_000832 [Potamilus streckersoni]|uniref:Uncharacterized protein n=1 Tax=Potamilus streckersoni TaxID=2493646 RepID=A0AAE0W9A0_9BIVA|nr:hypothetical protein CHS0354_000832 [Potamilus streckersoni]
MAKATYNGAKKALGGERPFLLTRAAFSGSQRYTAIWTGDNNSTDDHMLVGIRMINSLGISGYAFAGCDIGGFTGNPSSRLFTRWMTIAAFTPFFRGHSALNTNAAEPWAYGEFNEEIVKDFIQMRYNLMPYIYSIFYEAAETGMPIARSLAIENPYDDWVYNENFQNQFMLGDAILVAPTRSEEHFAKVYVLELSSTEPNVIMFFGDSITAGLGVDKDSAYPALLQKKIQANKLNYRVINAGLSGETTAGGVNRIDWMLKTKIDIFVLALGGNDVLRGLKPDNTEKNIITIFEKVKKKYPSVKLVLAGMKAPPNLGIQYRKSFDVIYPKAASRASTYLIPFILENVAGNKELNQNDAIHPNEKGHKIIADDVWIHIKKLLANSD